MMVVFIAAPYTADRMKDIELNVELAMDAGIQLMEKGHSPIVPHLSHWMDLYGTVYGVSFPYERWLEYTMSLVGRCDSLLYLAPSPGADRELELAERLGLRIFRSLEEVPCG